MPTRSTCPTCGNSFEPQLQFCPRDGSSLVAASPRDPLIGRVIHDRYRLLARLGRGGMGTVYRALHMRMDKPVAVKVLRIEMAGDAEAVARFHREARSASRLDHENCIRVSDFGQSDDGLLYLAMELLDGESLAALVARGPLAIARAAQIGRDVALALSHAHERGVIHRDLKADNVMIARRSAGSASDATQAAATVVKVLDFGLAKIAGEATGGPTLTQAGSVFGTPEYMAPEQAEGLPLDARTDLYALGVLLYLLFAGELPFRSPSYVALLAKQVEEPPVPMRTRRPDLGIPVEVDALVLRCLEKRAGDRPASAAEVAEGLAPFLDFVGSAHSHVEGERDAVDAGHLLAETDSFSSLLPSPSVLDAVAYREGDSDVVVPRSRSRSRIALVAGAVAVCAGIVVGTPFALSLRTPRVPPPNVDRLAEARRLLELEDLAAAEQMLVAERAAADGATVQMLLGELAQRRGNRLSALAHLHRATRISPRNAEAHTRLAMLLRLLGETSAACNEAQNALALDPHSAASAIVCKAPAGHAP